MQEPISCEQLEDADPAALDLSQDERALLEKLQATQGTSLKDRIDCVVQDDIEKFIRTALILAQTASDEVTEAPASLDPSNRAPQCALVDDFE